MLNELLLSLTVKAVAVGHSLYEAQCLAAVLVLQLVLLCTLMGLCDVHADRPVRVFVRDGRCPLPCYCGTLPAVAGTAGRTRSVLHR